MKYLTVAIACVFAMTLVNAFAETESNTITGKSISLESCEQFTLLGDMQTTTRTTNGQQIEETKQLDTKRFALYPSRLSSRGKIAAAGYIYICKVKVTDTAWHPATSNRVLGNIGKQIAADLDVSFRSQIDTRMNEAGQGMVRLFQSDDATITLMLVSTQVKDVFHLCGTYTVAK